MSFISENYVLIHYVTTATLDLLFFFYSGISWNWGDYFFYATCVLLFKVFCCSRTVWPGDSIQGQHHHSPATSAAWFYPPILKAAVVYLLMLLYEVSVQHSAVTKGYFY